MTKTAKGSRSEAMKTARSEAMKTAKGSRSEVTKTATGARKVKRRSAAILRLLGSSLRSSSLRILRWLRSSSLRILRLLWSPRPFYLSATPLLAAVVGARVLVRVLGEPASRGVRPGRGRPEGAYGVREADAPGYKRLLVRNDYTEFSRRLSVTTYLRQTPWQTALSPSPPQ